MSYLKLLQNSVKKEIVKAFGYITEEIGEFIFFLAL